MSNIFPIDFEEKLTMAQDDYILFSDSEDGNKIKKAQYKNLKGEPGTPGTPGKDGEDGAAATITVGSTTTGAAGSSASVTNSGTSSAAVLDFTIPQGAKGEPGEDGQDGADGAAATITVGTTTTLPAGSSATVTNVGTSQDAILNFGIPKGDAGTGSGDVNGPASSTDGDVALFDGATGKLIKDSGVSLADYQEKLTAGTNIQIQNNVISATGGSDIEYVTQAEYNALLPGAASDGKHYFIYSTSGGGGWQPGVNTLLYYSFDNQNLNDGSGKGNNGTWYSTAGTYTTGISSYGVDVSNNAAITLPIKLPSGDMTFSICANVTTTSGVLQGFLGVDGWVSAGQIAFSINDTHGIDLLIHEGGSVTSLVTNTTPTTNTWFNAIFTRSGNVWTVYYNGTSVGTATTSQSPSQSITYYISRNYNTTRYIRGVIDEVILENRAWTQQEITDYVTSLGIS